MLKILIQMLYGGLGGWMVGIHLGFFLGLLFSFFTAILNSVFIKTPSKYSYYKLTVFLVPFSFVFQEIFFVVTIIAAIFYTVNFYSYFLNLFSTKESFFHMLFTSILFCICLTYFLFALNLSKYDMDLLKFLLLINVINTLFASVIYAWKIYSFKKIQFLVSYVNEQNNVN